MIPQAQHVCELEGVYAATPCEKWGSPQAGQLKEMTLPAMCGNALCAINTLTIAPSRMAPSISTLEKVSSMLGFGLAAERKA
jgi:hypothetical protein